MVKKFLTQGYKATTMLRFTIHCTDQVVGSNSMCSRQCNFHHFKYKAFQFMLFIYLKNKKKQFFFHVIQQNPFIQNSNGLSSRNKSKNDKTISILIYRWISAILNGITCIQQFSFLRHLLLHTSINFYNCVYLHFIFFVVVITYNWNHVRSIFVCFLFIPFFSALALIYIHHQQLLYLFC